jgi:Bifunctional DNA primase/polymerase, N-terminal/AAA domain/Primase C terminal 2 (PriCT-2)
MPEEKPQIDMLNAALRLAKHGWPVFPCNPLNKKPLSEHGFKDATLDDNSIKAMWSRWPLAMIGVPTGVKSGFWVLDLDIDADKNGIAEWDKILLDHPEPIFTRVHYTPRGGRHLLFRQDPERPVRNSTSKIAIGIDVRGDGGYVIVPPSRTESGKQYSSNEVQGIAGAPDWLYDLVISDDPFKQQEQQKPHHQPTTEQVRMALSVIPNIDLGWDDWNRIGMATWRATNGNHAGLAAFVEWSKKSAKHNKKDSCSDRWKTYAKCPPTEIGVGTIFFLADQADPDWRDRYQDYARQKQKPIPNLQLEKLFPIVEEDIPTRLWIVPGLLMREALTMTAAPGGTGKSMLTIHVGIMLATGMQWAGWKPRQRSKVLIINSEENKDEMKRRAFAAASRMQADMNDLSDNLVLVKNLEDIAIAEYNHRTNSMRPLPLIEKLVAFIEEHKFDVVIIDPFAESFIGQETTTEMKGVGAMWRNIARRTHCAIWLVHHTRKYAKDMAGDIDAARGATAFGNVVRIANTLFDMTKEQAIVFGLPEADRRSYIRLDDAKANYHEVSGIEQWFRKETFHLQNQHGEIPGDNVGVLMPWTRPAVVDDEVFKKVVEMIPAIDQGIFDDDGVFLGEYYTTHYTQRAADRETFNRWVGLFIQKKLDVNEQKTKDVIKQLVNKNMLVSFDYRNRRNKDRLTKGCGSPAKRKEMDKLLKKAQQELDME